MSVLGERDEFGLLWFRVTAANGQPYTLYEIPEEIVLAIDGNVAAITLHNESVVVVRRNEPAGLFQVEGASLSGGPFGAYSDPRSFRLPDYEQMVVIPAQTYIQGQEAEELSPSAQTFNPGSWGWEAVPSGSWVEPSEHVQVIIFHGKRFARLTAAGQQQRRAMDEAARQARNKRDAAEADTARLRREEEEQIAAEAKERDGEERFSRWFLGLPIPPDTLVTDRREFNSRVGVVRYDGVTLRRDGLYDVPGGMDSLPRRGTVTYGTRPHPSNSETEDVQLYSSSTWDEWTFDIEGDPRVGALLPYTGDPANLGKRVERPVSPDGQVDKCLNAGSGQLKLILDIVGNNYSYQIDDLFTVEVAAKFLMSKSHGRNVHRTYPPEDDDGEADASRSTYQVRETETFEEQYQNLFESNGSGRLIDGLDDPWSDYPWSSHHHKMLMKELARRKDENAKWLAGPRQLLIRFSLVLGGRICAEPSGDDDGCIYGRDGLRVRLTIMEHDADRVAKFLAINGCQRQLFVDQDPEGPSSFPESVADGKLIGELFARFTRSKGRPALFKAMTNDLLQDTGDTQCVVAGLMPLGEIGLLLAPSKLGKTATAFDMGLCIAAGWPFGGVDGLATKKGLVVWISGEETLATLKERRAKSGALGEAAGSNFLMFGIAEITRDLEKDLEEIEDLRVAAVFIDSTAAYANDTNQGGLARNLMQIAQAFAAKRGCAVLPLHHTGKDLPAVRARSSKSVLEKSKGSAEFGFVARYTITLHLQSDESDDKRALATGFRVLTLHPGNWLSHVPRLRNSLVLRMDPRTGISHSMTSPVVGVEPHDAGIGLPEVQEEIASAQIPANDDDARSIAAVVHRLEKALGRAVPFAGVKAPFHVRAPELAGWSRSRCERGHRRAVELGLCKAAHPKKRSLRPRR